MLAPLRLRPDNFTPPTRTPWGGTKIRGRYKAHLDLPPGDPRVGESWEVSVEPSFPSRAVDGRALGDIIAADPLGWLGARALHRHGGQTPLLVKLLDAADDLSVQVHPADGDPALGPGESGKPEAWVVIDAEPGAGLYLGFRGGVTRAEVERCIARGGALDELMTFVPVAPGDTHAIAAGTPHAIGRGVTLVEPQLVRPGARGVTYRYWDWNRRYDAAGRPDPAGAPRELQLADSLRVTRFEVGDVAAGCRRTPALLEPGRERLLAWEWFVVERWHGDGELCIEATDSMWALVCVRGEARLGDALTLRMGESAVVPAAAGELGVACRGAEVIATRT